MKVCSKCKIPKERGCFFKHPRTLDGLTGICKECRAQYERDRYAVNRLKPEWVALKNKRSSESLKRNPEKNREKNKRNYTTEKGRVFNRRFVYGIEPEAYEALLKAQGGQCAICKKTSRLVIDHNHTTGKIRGLLCYRCNTLVGFFENSEEIKTRIKEYLSKDGAQDGVQ